MAPHKLIELLLHGNQLKRTIRSGWLQRGVPAPEDVAAHSYGVAFVCLVLSELVDQPVDLGRVLAMALLHDLPEGVTTDIPAPAWRYLPPGAKESAEERVMNDMLGGAPMEESWLGLWAELRAGETIESRLVHDADKLDMFLQAWFYEQSSSSARLQEFWDGARPLALPAAQSVFDGIKEQREAFLGRARPGAAADAGAETH